MKKEFTVKIEIDEDDISCLLANASAEECGVSWWKSVDPNARNEAERQLVAEGKDPCREDIWARMLMNGGKLRLLDPESDWHWKGYPRGAMVWSWQIMVENLEPEDGEWHDIGIDDIINAIQVYGKKGYANDCGADLKSINENGDFYDADAVIQIAMYGDVIYG